MFQEHTDRTSRYGLVCSFGWLIAFGLMVIWGLIGCSLGGEGGREGYVELHAADPLRHSYDFGRSDFGGVIQDSEIRNAGAHIDFGNYYPAEFTVGIQGDERGIIMDLGSDDELAAALAVDQTVGGGQGFAHLNLVDSTFNLPGANKILEAGLVDLETDMDHVSVLLDHVYAVRITSQSSKMDMVLKLMVTDLDPGASESVAFQWVRLR